MSFKKGDKVKYNGYLYRDSAGRGKGSKVNGIFTVTIVNNNSHGVHLDNKGWVRAKDLTKVNTEVVGLRTGDTMKVYDKNNKELGTWTFKAK